VSGFGTAQAIIVTAGEASTDGTDFGSLRTSFGFWDTTNAVSWSTHYEDATAIATAQNRSDQSATNVCLMSTGAVGIERSATASATTDGVTLTWAGSDVTIRPYVIVTLINGINGALAGAHTPNASDAGTSVETTTGITPKVVFGGMNRRNVGDGGAAWATTGFGFAYNNGATYDQYAVAWNLQGTTPNATLHASQDRIAVNLTTSSIETELEITAMASGSFTSTTRNVSGSGAEESDLYYLALDFDEDAAVIDVAVTTSAGDWTPLTGGSFTPVAVIMMPTFSADKTDIETSNEAGFFSWYIADGTNEYAFGWNFEDGAVTNTNCSGRTDQLIWNSDETAGTADFDASSPTFSSGTITYADANVTHSAVAKGSFVYGIAFGAASSTINTKTLSSNILATDGSPIQ
jgi:hypothetical protein